VTSPKGEALRHGGAAKPRGDPDSFTASHVLGYGLSPASRAWGHCKLLVKEHKQPWYCGFIIASSFAKLAGQSTGRPSAAFPAAGVAHTSFCDLCGHGRSDTMQPRPGGNTIRVPIL